MQSIIKELYYGNIRPEESYDSNKSYAKAARVQRDAYEKLSQSLGETEKELLENFLEAKAKIESITNFDTFSYALRFGVLLMAEIFIGNENTGAGGGSNG